MVNANEEAIAQLERILLEVLMDCAVLEAAKHQHLGSRDTLHWLAVRMVHKYAIVPPGAVHDPKLRTAIIAIASGSPIVDV